MRIFFRAPPARRRPARAADDGSRRAAHARAGNRTSEIRYVGRGHTRGDLVVHLPTERILFTGDLVSWPVPLVGTTSFPADCAATLEKLLALEVAILVPGHGTVMRDNAYARTVARLLASIQEQTAAAVARGETLEQASVKQP